MQTIRLTTNIQAPVEVCFDLARNIDLHKSSMKETKEEAVAGKTSGLIELGEEVTWRATHFAIRQKLTSRITAYNRPSHFCDEMVKGIFKSLKHDHYFESTEKGTIMNDTFVFEAPLGLFGRLISFLILKKYLKQLLLQRNELIKKVAEQTPL